MNQYTLSSLIAFMLFGMGMIAIILGIINYMENSKSRKGINMLCVCICVFFWDFGYAWMSLSYYDDFAYVSRAIALLSVTIYMFFILRYVALVTDYPSKWLNIFLSLFVIVSLVAWTQIIRKDAITFVTTPWGYWYTSKMSWARILQFASIIAAIVLYYFILSYGKKNTKYKREKYILNQFGWFGVILFTGYIFDTLIPTIAKIPAIPGSSISAFFSAMLLFAISRNNKTFGLSRDNVSEYVFQDVSIPVIITDNDNKIVLYNDITKEYMECDDTDLISQDINCFYEEIKADVTDTSLNHNLDNDLSLDYRNESSSVTFAKLRESDKMCKLEKTVVNDRYGELLYTIYFIQDITREISILEKLRESRIAAEAANDAKSQFLANISHEIRTPINAVLGMNEMIIRETSDNDILGYARDIEGAGKNLLSLINDILDISKIESGKMELIPVEYDLASVINDSYNTVYLRAKEKNLDLKMDVNEFIPSGLYGDEVRVRQIITNLLTNAVKYTKEGSVTLSMSYRQVSKNEINLIISVKDTGIGLTSEQQKQLFTNFKRFDEKNNRNIEGTGLGLSITKTFVDLMDGSINVKSERDVGSIFTVTILQKIVKDVPIGKINEGENNLSSKKQRYKESLIAPNANILVVDDIEMNIKVFKGLLKETKMHIDQCLSGQECLAAIKRQKYDIIFLDHMMPGMDGIEVFKNIKASNDHLNIETPIVMLTANAIVGAEDDYLKEGLDDYLSKPIQWPYLEKIIMKYLPDEAYEIG